MPHIVRSFIARLADRYLNWRLEREIYRQIAPHIHQERDLGYAFRDPQGLWQAAHHGNLDAVLQVERVEREADRMGKAYGDAFRYLMYRDLNHRLARYRRLMQRRFQTQTCDPRVVATRA